MQDTSLFLYTRVIISIYIPMGVTGEKVPRVSLATGFSTFYKMKMQEVTIDPNCIE